MRVLVTGAGGFVGGYMIRCLIEAGHEVAALSRDWSGPPLPDDIRRATVDLGDGRGVGDFASAVRPDGVIHLAAQASPGASWERAHETYRTNIEGTAHLLDAVRDLGARVLLIGSAQQYRARNDGRPLTEPDAQLASSPYGLTKIAQEQMGLMYMARYGLPVIFTRSFNHTGPGQSPAYAVGSFASQIALIAAGRSEPVLNVQNLDARRDLLDVRDVVMAYRALLEAADPGEAFNVCSGRALRMADVLDKLLQFSGLSGKVEVRDVPEERTDVLVGDPRKIRAAVGWEPQIPLESSLRQTLDGYRQNLEDGR